jgi:hypothetical protein
MNQSSQNQCTITKAHLPQVQSQVKSRNHAEHMNLEGYKIARAYG